MIIPIDKGNVPYQFEIELEGDVFVFEVHYNAQADFFTLDLHREDETLVLGEKLVYSTPLFAAYADERFPAVTITPYDRAGNENRVTYDNLGETVFLYVGDRDG